MSFHENHHKNRRVKQKENLNFDLNCIEQTNLMRGDFETHAFFICSVEMSNFVADEHGF